MESSRNPDPSGILEVLDRLYLSNDTNANVEIRVAQESSTRNTRSEVAWISPISTSTELCQGLSLVTAPPPTHFVPSTTLSLVLSRKCEVYWRHWISPSLVSLKCVWIGPEVLFDGLERNVFGPHAAAHVAEGESGAVERIRLAALSARWSWLAFNQLSNAYILLCFSLTLLGRS